MSIKCVLIANRGEIALRIIRSCKALGIKTVLAASDADKDSKAAMVADKVVVIGPPPVSTYLNIEKIISAAKESGADAVHPGYGFMAEKPEFSEACAKAGLVFIGPKAEHIEKMGNKLVARALAKECGVPTLPGSEKVASYEEVLAVVQRIGFPVMLKAAAGGGGRGMKVVTEENKDSLQRVFQEASMEALSAFGDGLREEIRACAVKLTKNINYESAGTIEFIYDEDQKKFYFLEMNTRIQVEHPVTEMVTGVDIVKEQLNIAAGGALPFAQEDITFRGHAIECRVNAEDPFQNFRPSPGVLSVWDMPQGPGIRVDSHCFTGYKVPFFYDSLIGKLIAYGESREHAIARMLAALDEFRVEGIKTTIPFIKMVLELPDFKEGRVTTHILQQIIK
ncbi:MAG: acetyl-CoA carboxylase biotin carboxylase subunit [Clostridia bacterium]|nr:acetyl-CoA carboxylase biotin carboxylase subunit [Clostridia bacterium]